MAKVNIAGALQSPTGILQQPIEQLGDRLGVPIRRPGTPPPAIIPAPPQSSVPGPGPGAQQVVAQQQPGVVQPAPGQPNQGAVIGSPQGALGQQQEAYSPDNPIPLSERLGGVIDQEAKLLEGIDAAKARTNADGVLQFADKWRDIQIDPKRSTFADIGKEPASPTGTTVARRQGGTEVFDYESDFGTRQRERISKPQAAIDSIATLAALAENQRQQAGALKTARESGEDVVPPGLSELKIGQDAARIRNRLMKAQAIDTGREYKDPTGEENAVVGSYLANQAKEVLQPGRFDDTRSDLIAVSQEGGQNVWELTPALRELLRGAQPLLDALTQKEPIPIKVLKNYNSNDPREVVTRDPNEGIIDFRVNIQESIPFRVMQRNGSLYLAAMLNLEGQVQQDPNGNVMVAQDIPTAHIAGLDSDYVNNLAGGIESAQTTFGKAVRIKEQLIENYNNVWTYSAEAVESQNRINNQGPQGINFVGEPIVRQLIGTPKPSVIHTAGRNDKLDGWKMGVAHTLYAEPGLKEGDFTPEQMLKNFESPNGIDTWAKNIGDPTVAVQQINAMQAAVQEKMQNPQSAVEVKIPEFLLNIPELWTGREKGFGKAAAYMDLAQYLHNKKNGQPFISELNVGPDGNANGIAIQGYYTGHRELSNSTGMINHDSNHSFDGEEKIRGLIGTNLEVAHDLANTPERLNLPDEDFSMLREITSDLFKQDSYRKQLLTPVGYGQDTYYLNEVINDYFAENDVLKRKIEQVVGADHMEDYIDHIAGISGQAMRDTLGADTFRNYTQPLGLYSVFARILEVPSKVRFKDGSVAKLYDTTIVNQGKVGQSSWYGPEGELRKVDAYQYKAVPDAEALGKPDKNRDQRPGHTAGTRSSPVLTHNVDAAHMGEMLEQYNAGQFDYSFMQLFDAAYVPAWAYPDMRKRMNGAIKKVLEAQDPVAAVDYSFDAVLMREFNKRFDSLPSFIDPEDTALMRLIRKDPAKKTQDLEYVLRRYVVDPDYSRAEQVGEARIIGNHIRTHLATMLKVARQPDGTVSKEDYRKAVMFLIKEMGGRERFTNAANRNKRVRFEEGIPDAPKSQFS